MCTSQPSGTHVVTQEVWFKYLKQYGANTSSGIIAIISNVIILISILRSKDLRCKYSLLLALAASDMTFGIAHFLLGIMRLQFVSQGTHKVSCMLSANRSTLD